MFKKSKNLLVLFLIAIMLIGIIIPANEAQNRYRSRFIVAKEDPIAMYHSDSFSVTVNTELHALSVLVSLIEQK